MIYVRQSFEEKMNTKVRVSGGQSIKNDQNDWVNSLYR